ncbi:polyprenyl synthetase family protein [Arthrobacter sp. NPDC057388]|uniref:polyprenyl synthetase family protein n=1 Tax=Arthrobacter sp. NPDC057388 TaxID=3346116 RepID=UPI00364569D2
MGTVLAHTDGAGLIDEVLTSFFARSKARAEAMHPEYLSLWQCLERTTAGGKRFRPRLVMTAHDLLGGSDRVAAATVAAAFELLHTALIVHDDVIDRDYTRRGAPNVAGTYRNRAAASGSSTERADHTGLSTAVIAGDLALSNAYRLLSEADVDPPTRQRLGDLLDEAIVASAAGELLDVLAPLDSTPQTVDEVLTMSKLKTAVYSFDAPLCAGAVLAGADQELVGALGEFGRTIGTAYQVADDLIAAFGDEALTGKTGWGDLREGKRTALISYAAGQSQWTRIAELMSRPDLTAQEATEIRELLAASGARDETLRLAADLTEQALDILVRPVIPQTLRDGLKPLSRLVTDRMGA